MKVIKGKPEFNPVTLVLETPGEVLLVAKLLGGLTDSVSRSISGAPVPLRVYEQLVHVCGEDRYHSLPPLNIKVG